MNDGRRNNSRFCVSHKVLGSHSHTATCEITSQFFYAPAAVSAVLSKTGHGPFFGMHTYQFLK